jgi:hypothetical protein
MIESDPPQATRKMCDSSLPAIAESAARTSSLSSVFIASP